MSSCLKLYYYDKIRQRFISYMMSFHSKFKFLNDPENCNNLIDFHSKLTKNLVFLKKNVTPHLTKFLTEEKVFNKKFSCHKSYGTE